MEELVPVIEREVCIQRYVDKHFGHAGGPATG